MSIDKRTGNLISGLGRFNGRKGVNTFKNSNKGYYHVAFTDRYNKVTERDIELKESYARDSISKYANIPRDLINLQEKKSTQTTTALDTVYYVKVGQTTLGKVSIRVQRLFTHTNLLIIFQEKRTNKSKYETRKRTN